MYALFPLCFFHRVFLYFLHLFSCFQTDSRSSLKASKNDRFETLKADSFFRVLQTNPPHFQKFNQSTYIYIYISISIPLESSLGQVFPHCLNMIHIFCKTLYEWTPPKLQIDAKNDCLENALPFKHAMLGELFNHVHLSAPSKMRKKHGKNEKSHVFQEQPRAQLRWLENLTTSQYLRRR